MKKKISFSQKADLFQKWLGALGWSDQELAERAGVTRRTVSRWYYAPPTLALEYLRICVDFRDATNKLRDLL